jgi:eukaryotic-like serine/threonine-protein kinase
MLQVPEDPRLGTVVDGRYRVLERVAAGGMGVVYRGELVQLGRAVAMKFLHGMLAGNQEFLSRFFAEAQLMSRLHHPHCVSVMDFGVADSPYIIMEFVTGTTLKSLVEEQGRLEPRRAIRITRQILAGVAHAHEQGIVHRDMKPANVMLAEATGTGDHARIVDFGIAKVCDTEQSLSSGVLGTPSYISPEQAAGQAVDGRADLYAIGLILFELLTGQQVFYSENGLEVVLMHREQPPPRLADACPDMAFSDQLEDVVSQALAKAPAQRFQDAAAFAASLAQVPEAQGQVAPPSPRGRSVPGAPERTSSAHPAATRRSYGRWLALSMVAAGGLLAWSLSADELDRGTRWVTGQAKRAAATVDQLRRQTAEPEAEAGHNAAKDTPQTVDAVKAAIAAGDQDGALRGLHVLRRRQPDNAEVSFLLGELYFAKTWWAEALVAYGEAITKDPDYRHRDHLVDRVVQMLTNADTRDNARIFVVRRLGVAAVPALRRAEQDGRNQLLAGQARALLHEIGSGEQP